MSFLVEGTTLGAQLTAYPGAPRRQINFDDLIGQLLSERALIEPIRLLKGAVGESVDAWVKAIRHVRVRETDDVRTPVVFEREPVHAPNSAHERGFCALMLIVQRECIRARNLRSCSKRLWRGKRERFVVDDEGDFKRVYVRAVGADGKSGHQGGLAARLGRSVKTVDRYLRIAKAAGFLNTWQVRGKKALEKLPQSMKGKKFAYAVFQWLGPVARAVVDRVRGSDRAAEVETPRVELATAPTPPVNAVAARLLALVDSDLARPSRPPS